MVMDKMPYARMYVCMYACVCMCVHVHIRLHVCVVYMYVCACTRVYILYLIMPRSKVSLVLVDI